ncbi:helix-turn-helix domain-containing protein [Curtobacterium sp. MCBD17_040]|uniref:helix-turn-helix domain-containing protein n=1 Tax=Curtobacterium sp. MCBD17_040 TaxID=2175674 RepID=UPI0032E869A2
MAEPWSVADLAAALASSESTLFARFRQVTGMTPVQYLRRVRLGEARHRMVVLDETAMRAATAVGYRSASHFSRDYRAMYGAPPAADAERARMQLTTGAAVVLRIVGDHRGLGQPGGRVGIPPREHGRAVEDVQGTSRGREVSGHGQVDRVEVTRGGAVVGDVPAGLASRRFPPLPSSRPPDVHREASDERGPVVRPVDLVHASVGIGREPVRPCLLVAESVLHERQPRRTKRTDPARGRGEERRIPILPTERVRGRPPCAAHRPLDRASDAVLGVLVPLVLVPPFEGGGRRAGARHRLLLPVTHRTDDPLPVVVEVRRPPGGRVRREDGLRDRSEGLLDDREAAERLLDQRRLPGHGRVDGAAERREQRERLGPCSDGPHGRHRQGTRQRAHERSVDVELVEAGEAAPGRASDGQAVGRVHAEFLCDGEAQHPEPRRRQELTERRRRHHPTSTARRTPHR